MAGHQGRGRLTELVRQSWDLAAIEAEYEEFIARFSVPSAGDPLVSTVELVHAWRRFPWIDPLLPDELLPEPWSGVVAASLFARRHGEWAADARAAWQALPS